MRPCGFKVGVDGRDNDTTTEADAHTTKNVAKLRDLHKTAARQGIQLELSGHQLRPVRARWQPERPADRVAG